ncbi:unnamed protein product [Mytilus edulis]|uniref:Uncharacterized protein n=1 Tax=Mytilus edulis TaxID=6550 RepID=A0A8S3TZT4_MYTED|nr:unnamed protein product [Mytilus edulis]
MKSRGNYKINNKQIEDQINIIKRNEADIEIRAKQNESLVKTTAHHPKSYHSNRILVSEGAECIQNTDEELLRYSQQQKNRKELSQRNINKRLYDQRTSMLVIAQQSQAEEIERQNKLQQQTNQADNKKHTEKNLLHKAGDAAIPKCRRKIKINSKGKAIWNEQIEKVSKQSENAYKVLMQYGAPQERSNELKIKMTAAKEYFEMHKDKLMPFRENQKWEILRKLQMQIPNFFTKSIEREKVQGIDHVNVMKVNKAIKKLIAGKAPDGDGISSERYKHGMEELTSFIAQLPNLMLTYLDIPIFLKTGTLTSILKKEKDKTLSSSYRGITVTKTFAKNITEYTEGYS